MKKLFILSLFTIAFTGNTTKCSAQWVSTGVNLYFECLEDTIYFDTNGLIRSNNSRFDEFLLDMKPYLFLPFDSIGYKWCIHMRWYDLKITYDSFSRKVISWIDSTNDLYRIQGLGNYCIHYEIKPLAYLNIEKFFKTDQSSTVSPNPGQLTYTISNAIGTLRVYDILGNFMQEQFISSVGNSIKLNAPAGIYYFQIKNNNTIETHKIIHSP